MQWTEKERLDAIRQISIAEEKRIRSEMTTTAIHGLAALQTIHYLVVMPAAFLNLNIENLKLAGYKPV